MKCAACSRGGLRRTYLALIVPAGRWGRVCGECDRLAIKLVVGDDRPEPKRNRGSGRASRRELLTTPALALGPALPVKGARCGASTDRTRRRCALPKGHEGSHRSILGQSWSETT